jgi:L-aspartate oxidase
MNQYDYIVVGSGIAGLYGALLAKEHGSVLVITKGSIDDCNTRFAQGGIAAAIGRKDSPELHFKDTISAGAGLCNEEAVRILVDEAADCITDLVNLGMPFDTLNGEIALAREAAHSVPRILHAGGDATGEHIEITLSGQVRSSAIDVFDHCLGTRILAENKVVRGIEVLDCHTGALKQVGCRFLILATGGTGQLFKFTTNAEVATGDGITLAFDAGAETVDMEFYQFHPTSLHLQGAPPFLISEAVRGEGGVLRNKEGHRFMPDYAKEAEMAPRDIVARSTVYEMEKTGADEVYLDITHLPSSAVTTRFPNIYHFCLEHGLDITRDLIPVAPAAHYTIGGIRTNTWGETNIAGLFACGETASTGVHGANRLASNSLLEAVVFSKRVIRKTAGQADTREPSHNQNTEVHYLSEQIEPPKTVPALSLPNLQQLCWNRAGMIRNGEGLAEAAGTLAAWQKYMPEATDRPSFELRNLVLAGRLMAEAALLRKESRGTHFRSDFPEPSPQWQRHIIFIKR